MYTQSINNQSDRSGFSKPNAPEVGRGIPIATDALAAHAIAADAAGAPLIGRVNGADDSDCCGTVCAGLFGAWVVVMCVIGCCDK